MCHLLIWSFTIIIYKQINKIYLPIIDVCQQSTLEKIGGQVLIFKAQNQVRNIYFLFDFIMGDLLSYDRLELVRKNGSFLKYGYRGGPVNL